jgi:hypothetical protein
VPAKDPAVTEATLGAWLVKANPLSSPLAELAATGFATVTSRCVRPGYRAELIREGQPVLLWISGRDPRLPAGLHAVGRTTGGVDDDGGELAMPIRLRPLEQVVAREEILAHPLLSHIEVVRMPAGSNPSYLDRAQWQALCEDFPQITAV